MQNITPTPQQFTFLLLPSYSALTLSAAVSAMCEANRFSDTTLYQWRFVSLDGAPCPSAEFLRFEVDASLQDATIQSDEHVIICGNGLEYCHHKALIKWLKTAALRRAHLGGLGYGCYLLAAAGLLDGYSCTTHWDYVTSMQAAYPYIHLTPQLFVVDRDRFTCSGGNSVLDLMLYFIQRDHGTALSQAVASHLIHDRPRRADEKQPYTLPTEIVQMQPKLAEAISLMEANIEEIIPVEELSNYLKISIRQLERLFKKYLNCSPSQYYKTLRLTKAQQLLWQTNMSITEIALSCGFTSVPHFSKCFRQQFNLKPSNARQHPMPHR